MTRVFWVCALLMAVLLESVLWGVRAGPGWLLVVVASLGVSQFLRRRLERPLRLWTLVLWLLAGLYGLATTLYDSEVVHLLGPGLCSIFLLLACLHTICASPQCEFLGQVGPWSSSALGVSLQSGCASLPSAPRSVLPGLLKSIPLCLVFGLLFLSADPAYLESWQYGLSHGLDYAGSGVRVLAAGWLLAALFWKGLSGPGPARAPQACEDGASWSSTLAVINLLFFSFLRCQADYLFRYRAPAGMTLAEYARHGFFELFVAALLVVLLFTVLHQRVGGHYGRGLALGSLVLLLQTLGLVASSWLRMHLYIESFGLTLTRAYVVATLGGIVVTLLVCGGVLLFPRSPGWLQSRLLLLGAFSLAGVGLTNIEAWVTRTNLTRPQVDYAYLQQLSWDILPELTSQDVRQQKLREAILAARPAGRDWREWNASRGGMLAR